MRARGLRREDTFAVGDSREDLAVAGVVGTFWLVANGARARPDAAPRRCAPTPTCASPRTAHGAGVYEAVITTLAERR